MYLFYIYVKIYLSGERGNYGRTKQYKFLCTKPHAAKHLDENVLENINNPDKSDDTVLAALSNM